MAVRPYWRGQIRISLVTFPVALRSAMQRGSQVPLHQVERDSGERIHHLNVTESGKEVEYQDIIKAYGPPDEQVTLEKEEIDAIKLPSSDVLELDTFVEIAKIPVDRYERPYFVLPDGEGAQEIYAVIHQAMADSATAGIGQITMRGREELCALLPAEGGLMLETLRYDRELLDPAEILPKLGHRKLKSDYVDLANQLIRKNTVAPDFAEFHDRYHEALLELIHAKKAHRKPRLPKPAEAPAKVVDFMDALQRSLDKKKGGGSRSKSPRRRQASHAQHRKRRVAR